MICGITIEPQENKSYYIKQRASDLFSRNKARQLERFALSDTYWPRSVMLNRHSQWKTNLQENGSNALKTDERRNPKTTRNPVKILYD